MYKSSELEILSLEAAQKEQSPDPLFYKEENNICFISKPIYFD